MKRFQQINRYKVFIIFSLCLIPLIWFLGRPGVLITGSDTNFPLNPDLWFHRRLFTWQAIDNAGSDFSASVAGTFFHLLQFIPFKLGVSLQGIDILNLLFWFSLIIISSYILSRIILPKKYLPQLIFVILYSLNIYLFNSFENVKVANLSLVAAIPLGISLLLLLRNGSIHRLSSFIFAVIIGIILSGAGINPAYITCFFVILFIFLLSEIFIDLANLNLVKQRIVDFAVVSLFIILPNSFWIIPTVHFIFANIATNNSIGSIGFVNWVDSLSQNTSLINVLRMQGAWDWYSFDSVTGIPLYIPYAMRYFLDPLFIAFSFIIPSFAFLAYLFKKKTFELFYIFFGVILVLGLFLTAGTHEPTGTVFRFFANHVPFFTLFRSPWYIFAPLVGLSTAGLASIFFYNLDSYLPRRFYLIKDFGICLFIVGAIIYSYPLVLGKIFRPSLPTNFYITFPNYVFNAEKYLNTTESRGRILSYPDDNIENFKWGYAAVDSILNLITDREIIYSNINGTTSSLSKTTNNIYESIKRGESVKAQNLASVLGIGQVFYKQDQGSLAPILPDFITRNLAASFGEWKFYNLGKSFSPKIYSSDQILASYPNDDTNLNLEIGTDGTLINPDDKLLSINNLSLETGEIVHAKNSQTDGLNNNLNIDPNVVEYSFFVPKDGSYQPVLQKYMANDNIVSLLLDGQTVKWNIKSSDDSFLYFGEVYLKSGNHQVEIILNNKNLISQNNFLKEGTGTLDFTNNLFTLVNKSNTDIDFKFPVNNFDPFSNYFVTGNYMHIYGQPVKIVAQQGNKGTLYKNQPESFVNSPEFEKFQFYFSPVESPTQLFINLAASENKNDSLGTKVEYSDPGVYRVFNNDLFFREPAEKDFVKPDVNFTIHSPVSYTGKVSGVDGPHIIIFDENYSNDWDFKIEGDNTAKAFHFMANGYENAWYIDGANESYNFSIYYKPQNLLKIGYVISFATIISALGIFIIIRFRKTKR